MKLRYLISIILVCLAGICLSQEILVKDINTLPGGLVTQENNYPTSMCDCNGLLYLPVDDEKGIEIWRTDGTANGTTRLKDIAKGSQSAHVGNYIYGTCLNNKFIFFADDKIHGIELWVTDGTEQGTSMVKDIAPGFASTTAYNILTHGNKAYFISSDWPNAALWETDGTEAGTKEVVELPVGDGSYFPFAMVPGGDYFYFSSVNYFNPSLNKVYRSDGTADGTFVIGTFEGIAYWMKAIDNNLYLAVNNSQLTYQLWKLDGFNATVLTDLPGYTFTFHRYGNKLVFTSGTGVWITDGTAAGTFEIWQGGTAYSGVEYHGGFYWIGYNYPSGNQALFRTNGTPGGTELVREIGRAISVQEQLMISNDRIIIPFEDTFAGFEIATSQGTPGTSGLLKDLNPFGSSDPRTFTQFGNRVVFVANDGIHGYELWITNGSPEGTMMFADVKPGTEKSRASRVHVNGDKLFFIATSGGDLNMNLWSSDGTDAGTTAIQNIPPAFYMYVGQLQNEEIVFSESAFYKTNGGPGEKFLDLSGHLSNYALPAVAYQVNDKLLFAFTAISGEAEFNLGLELWVTDGTNAGTHVVKDISPGPTAGVLKYDAAVSGNYLFFPANDGVNGEELWKTDGTSEGTSMVKDINPGSGSSSPLGLVTYKGKVYFTTVGQVGEDELWVSDGTEQGTLMFKDIYPSVGAPLPGAMVSTGDHLYYLAHDENVQWKLWRTDGTGQGTNFVCDIQSTSLTVGGFLKLTNAGNKVFFPAYDEEHGMEVWSTDGTDTHVLDVIAGPEGSYPSLFTAGDGVVYFKADNKLYATDGENFSQIVSELEPVELVFKDDWLYFTASSREYGFELYKVKYLGRRGQTLVFTTIHAKTIGDPAFSLEATASSGLPVEFTAQSDNIEISGSQLELVAAGRATVSASQEGNDDFFPASASQEFCVNPAKPSIERIDGSPASLVAEEDFDGYQWFLNGVEIEGATEDSYEILEAGTYSLQVQVDGCISEISEDVEVIVTGIDELKESVLVYPNPAMSDVTIKTSGLTEAANIEVCDITGKVLAHYSVAPFERIDHNVEGYKPSMYFVKMTTPKGVVVRKFSKK